MSCQRSREKFPRETIPYQYNECRNQLPFRSRPGKKISSGQPSTNIEWVQSTECAQLWLMTSFLLDPHLEGFKGAFSSLGIFTRLSASFFFHRALSPREPAKRCSPACALHPGYIKGISACHLACLPVSIYHFYVDLVSCAPSTVVCHVVLATRFDRVHKYRSREGHPHLQ